MGKKQSLRENILMMAAMSGGNIKKDICRDMCRSESYYKKLMMQMKRAEEAETVFGQNPRTLHIKKNGIDAVRDKIPNIMEMYESRMLCQNKEKTTRRAEISQVIYNMQLAGVPCYPGEKGRLYDENGLIVTDFKNPSYFTPYEIKQNNIDAMRGSRTCGIIVGPNEPAILYNMEDRNIKFVKKTERTTYAVIQKCLIGNLNKIVFGYEMEKDIIRNREMEREFRAINTRDNYNRVTPEDGMYYIPNGESGTIYLRLYFHPEVGEMMVENIKTTKGISAVSLLPMYLPTCCRIKGEFGELGVVCLDEQKDFIKWLNDGKNIKIFSTPEYEMKKYLDALEKR